MSLSVDSKFSLFFLKLQNILSPPWCLLSQPCWYSEVRVSVLRLNLIENWAIPFFIHTGGWTNFSRGFLMKVKKFPGGLRKNKRFPAPNNMQKIQGQPGTNQVQLQKFPGTVQLDCPTYTNIILIYYLLFEITSIALWFCFLYKAVL